MLTQINDIQETINAILSTTPKDKTSAAAQFDSLDTEVQVTLSYNMARNAHNTMKWWSNLLVEAEAAEEISPERIKNIEAEVRSATIVYQNLCAFLGKTAHYVEGANTQVNYDHGSFDAIEGHVTNDDISQELTSIKAHPYAWARDSLHRKGIWQDIISETLVVPMDGFNRAVANTTSQVIGRWLVQASAGLPIGSKRDGLDLQIMAVDYRITGMKWATDPQQFLKQLVNLVRGNKGFVFNDDKSRTPFQDLLRNYPDMRDDLEDEIQEQEIKQKSREVAQKIRVRTFQQGTFDLLLQQIKALKEKGAKKADLQSLIEPFENDITAKQMKALLAA